jgi:hypothetical protein
MRLPRDSLHRYTPFSVLHQNKASVIKWTTRGDHHYPRSAIDVRLSEPNGNIRHQGGVETTPGKKYLPKIIRYGYEYLAPFVVVVVFQFSSTGDPEHTEMIVPHLAALVAAAAFSETLTSLLSAFLHCLGLV